MLDIHLGNCLDRLPNITNQSIDMILTDLPYGTTALSWDSIIPFQEMWKEIERVIKDKGCICLFGVQPFTSALINSNIKLYKYDWVWVKNRPTGFVNAKLMPLKNYENIVIFSKGTVANKSVKNMNYYPQDLVRIDKMVKGPAKPTNANSYWRPSQKPTHLQEFTNYPKNVLYFSKDEGKKLHPTQKPIALLEYLIKTYTLENDTVLDFTAGSFSTAIACLNTRRNFIGIEKDEAYFKIGIDRIEKHIKTLDYAPSIRYFINNEESK